MAASRTVLAGLAAVAIFHGVAVAPAERPWFATLEAGGPVCGGALIAPDRVLTAAHCVQGSDPGAFNVRIGGRTRAWRGAFFPPSYRIIPSPVAPDDLSASGTVNDIAVIVLAAPVTDVAPLPLAATPPARGEATLTVGRGLTGPRSGPPAQPRGAAQKVVECLDTYGPRLLHPSLHLCTRDDSERRAQACAGDSGSPVLVRRAGALQLAGVVTWGGETLGRACGAGPADVSERALAHHALITGPAPAFAPYAERAVFVRRRGNVRRCVLGRWHPVRTQFTVRWFRPTPAGPRFLQGSGRKRAVRKGPIACLVTARTAGGWVRYESYNAS